MPLKSAKTFKEEEYWANLYGETIATPNAALPPATPEPEPEMGNFTRGLNYGLENMQALAGGAKALYGSQTDNPDMVDSGMEIYNRNMQEAEKYAGDVMAIEDIDYDLGKAGKWLAFTAGTVVPDITVGLATGFGGGMLMKKAAQEGVKSYINKEAKDTLQDTISKGIESDAKEFLAKELGEDMAKDQIASSALKGSLIGSAVPTAIQSSGGSFARILQDTGVESPLTATGVGIVSGALEALPFSRAFKSVFPTGNASKFKDFIASELAEKPAWAIAALKDMGEVGGIGFVTEGMQFFVDDLALTYVNNNFSENEAREYFDQLSNERKRSDLINQTATGGVAGLGLGAGAVAVKTVTGQYGRDTFSDQAGEERTKQNNDPDRREQVKEFIRKYEAEARGEQTLTQPTEADMEFLNQNEPLTPEQRKEAGLSELTDYDGNDMVIPEGTEPDVVPPEITPVTEVPQQAVVAEDSLPTADIVTDFESAPAFGERPVPANSTESGTVYEYHNFEGELSDPAKPVTDQLVELSVAATTPEALDPNNTDVVVEAIDADDVDRMFDRNDFLKMETNDEKGGKSLPTVDESFGENSQEATNVVAGVVADLSASGVPKSFLDAVTGIYVHKESEVDVPALTGSKSFGISINSGLISGAVSDPKQLSELAWSMTHEVYHAADFSMGLSDKDPQFGMTIVSERDQPTVVMGDVMDEIFTNWENRTELGKRFDYPFNDLQKEINDRDKQNEGLDKSYRQEVFAQLGAMFHSNPTLLQEQSPLAYNFIKGIRDSNLKTNNVPEVQSEGTSSPSDPNTTESTGLRGQVRAPPESGSVESAPVADTGSDGEGSTGVGRTDSAVEGQAQEKVGERERPAVQEPDVEVPTTVPTTVPTAEPIAEATPERQEVEIKLSDKKPTFKKADNWEDTGNHIVTFADGDRYTVFVDDNAQEAGEETFYNSEDGKISRADGMLGETKQETINEIQEHRQKLFDAGKNSYNVPLDPIVSSDTSSKAYNLITDHPEGKLELTKVRKKFKKLEDNQFDRMIADLIKEEGFSLDDGVLSDPETVKEIEEERLADERMMAEDEEFQNLMDDDLDDPSFIKKGAEYLLEKSEGELPSKKLVPVKSLTAKTDAEKNLAMVDTIVSNHPNALDSPESWSAFERELTGSNTTIAPPYGLIKLVNNPKIWAKNHSTLTPQQLEAADRGLATAKRMGALYESGAADSEATGKLLLWGLMSRMLTASAQEAGFVDLLTNSTAVTNLIEKALTGSFTDKTATRMVEVPKTKKKPKHMVEKTYNADIAEWRDYVQESIPQGSFGRSGTSNANDFGALMMKMSDLDDAGVSKLQRLHDLMADRSVSTAEVRRQFQAMVQGSGIDNKVFSFAQLMIGRDDVVILDRIQLNSMWDSDRYGKNIYDDIADEFGALRGAARYEAIENALKSKVKDLYTSLGRPADASVGRYHWESWVRDSGQVVAHPTMIGLENDIKGKKSPYALLGAPEGKMNTYAYSAIYARDEAGDSYYVYPNSNGTFFKFDLSKWIEFKNEIPKPKNGIVDKNFKVSNFDKGIPWYESDQVNRQKLDGLIESYAKRKALTDEYSAEGAIASNDPDGFRRKRIYDRLRSPQSSDGSGSQNEEAVPQRFRKRTSGRVKFLLDGTSLQAYKRTLSPSSKSGLVLAESYNQPIYEIEASSQAAEIFASRMQKSKDANDYGASVFVYSPEEYQAMQLLVTEDGTAGIAIDGESIVSLFSDRTNKRVTYALLSLAIENGGRTADAFDTALPAIYQDLGMKVVSRLKWDDSQAPDGWDKKTFSKYNDGEPDVVFLKHDPEYFDNYSRADGYYVDTYDEGLASLVDRDVEDVSFIKKKQNNEKNNTLDNGTPSTSKFTFRDEIDSQFDLRSRFRRSKNTIVRKFSDRYDWMKKFEDQGAEYLHAGRLPADLSPRDQENLSHGKVQKDLNEFHKNFVDPLGTLIHDAGFDIEAVGTYLLAKHASERNAHILEKEKEQRANNIARTEKEIERLEDDVEVDHTVAIATQRERLERYKILPFKFEDTGSGMTNAEAQSVLNTAEREGTKEAIENIASAVYKMMDFQRDIMVKSGLLDKDTREDWEEKFDFYVPLKGFAAEPEGDSYASQSVSRGFSVVGKESMRAKGRKTLPVNPLLTAIEDVQKKIIRARKNETAQVLLELLSKLGDSDSYTIYNNKFRPPKESDPLTMQDLDFMSRDRRPNGDPKYVEVKKGGQTFFIYFKSDTLNHSLQNMSVPMLNRSNEDLGNILNFLTKIQNFRRNMYINYNPSWAFINPLRDIPTGLMYSLAEMDKKGSRTKGENIVSDSAKIVPDAMRSLYRYYREKPAREGNEMDQYTIEFHEDGAQTGLMLIDNPAEQLRRLKSKLKKGSGINAIRAVGKWVEDFNTAAENGVRLAIYVAARKAGATRAEGATLGKDSTVNFNRKGESVPAMNALYLFFGAAVRGNVNIYRAMTNDGSSGKKTTSAQKAALGLVALGAGIAALNIYNSEDDDDGDKEYADIPEHAKNRVLLIMGTDGEEGLAAPVGYGYNFFTNIGRYAAEYFMGVSEASDIGMNLFDNMLLNFVPIHHAKGDDLWESLRGFYPNMMEMHMDVMANKNYFGGEIAIEQNPLFVQRSDSYVARRSTSNNLKETAQFINDATGGDEFENGYVHPSPERMKYILQYWLGGAGKSLGQGVDVINKALMDEEIMSSDIPVASSFIKSRSEYTDRFEYYDNWEEVRQMKTQITQTTDPKELEDLYKRFKPYVTVQAGEVLPVLQSKDIPNLYDLANKNLIAIRKQRKLLEKIPQGAITEDARKRKADELDKQEALVFDLFNKAYRKAEKKANN